MDVRDRSTIILICEAIRKADRPLSRLEIAQALDGETIPEMGRILELMIKQGILKAKESKSQNNTSTFCYSLKEGFDLDQWRAASP